jgi:hypothetical protein
MIVRELVNFGHGTRPKRGAAFCCRFRAWDQDIRRTISEVVEDVVVQAAAAQVALEAILVVANGQPEISGPVALVIEAPTVVDVQPAARVGAIGTCDNVILTRRLNDERWFLGVSIVANAGHHFLTFVRYTNVLELVLESRVEFGSKHHWQFSLFNEFSLPLW